MFLIYKEIQNGAVAKSNMRKGFLIYEEMGKYLTVYEEAVSHIWLCNCFFLNFLPYEEDLIFFFISVGWNCSRWPTGQLLPVIHWNNTTYSSDGNSLNYKNPVHGQSSSRSFFLFGCTPNPLADSDSSCAISQREWGRGKAHTCSGFLFLVTFCVPVGLYLISLSCVRSPIPPTSKLIHQLFHPFHLFKPLH